MDAVVDSPWPLLLEDTLAVAPAAKVVLSVREPREWAAKQAARHGSFPICHATPHCGPGAPGTADLRDRTLISGEAAGDTV